MACVALGLAAPAIAPAAETSGAPAPPAVLESCVGPQALRFGPRDQRVVLAAGDAARVSETLMRRYPVVEADGLAPQRLMLWRAPGTAWLYVALLENPARPTQSCFTATFVARTVEETPALVAKYFPGAPP